MKSRQEKTWINRRTALGTTGMGMLAMALARGAAAQAAASTAQERANIKVVEDFTAAWNAKDGEKVKSYCAEDMRFSGGALGQTTPWRNARQEFADVLALSSKVELIIIPGTMWARGPAVVHERTSDIYTTWHGIGHISGRFICFYTLRDGKILDFIDFLFARLPDRG